MDIKEQEALAAQLYALHEEALGFDQERDWNKLHPKWKEAWVQVAQFVMAKNSSNEITITKDHPNIDIHEAMKPMSDDEFKEWLRNHFDKSLGGSPRFA